MADRKTYATVDDYIQDHTPEVTEKLYQLRACILKIAPDATELFNYGIPAFALVKGGKRDQQVMIAGYKNHIGFYPHPTTMAHFKEALSTYKQGKGSVQFPIDQPLPQDLIMAMVDYRRNMLLV